MIEIPSGKVIVDYWAPWCAPCKSISSSLEEIASEYGVKVLKINLEEDRDTFLEQGVQSIPTLVFYADGVEGARTVGAIPKREIVEAFGLSLQ